MGTQFYTILPLFLGLNLFIVQFVQSEKCTKINACSCKKEDGFVLDLSKLSNNDNTPFFADVAAPGSSNDLYSYNPCAPFTEGSGSCQNVAVCLQEISGPVVQYVSLGTQNSVEFSASGKTVDLMYSDGSVGPVTIHVMCQKNTAGTLSPIGNTGTLYEINLLTDLVCDKEEGKLSVGSIILIGFASLVFVYIVVGVPIQMFVRKQSGRHIIPNADFWITTFSNIKNGILFVVRCGKVDKYYNSI